MRRSRLIDRSAVRLAKRQLMVLICVQIAVIALLFVFASNPQP